jgi:hypothetical protein
VLAGPSSLHPGGTVTALQSPTELLGRAVGRPVARPSIAAFEDAARRAVHAARHSRLGRTADQADIFNLDLHVGVVRDVQGQLDRRGLSMLDWTLSGHSWVRDRSRDPVAVVNERTWHAFGPRLVRRFRAVYGAYLRRFHGFLATYPPCFALLYEGLEKPTLAVVATRYEWPFTHHGKSWEWLNASLRRGVSEGWLTLVANNRADADYLENYSGLHARHIPSACSYIGVEYTGSRAPVVICTGNDELANSIASELRHDAIPLRAGLGAQHSKTDLYDYRALVFIPYNVSIMALFEHYSACAPIYVPDRAFLKTLMQEHPADVLSSLSFTQVTGRPAAAYGRGSDLNDVRDEAVVDWYLDRADFYDAMWMPRIRQFESWAHLDHLLGTDDPRAISADMSAERDERISRIDALWDELGWMQEVARLSGKS